MADRHKPCAKTLIRTSFEVDRAVQEVIKELGINKTDYIRNLIMEDLKARGEEVVDNG